MSADDIELFKAGVQGATAGTVEALVAPISEFVNKLLGPSVEQAGGLLGTEAAYVRLKRWVKTMEKAKALLERAGVDPHDVPRPILMPIFGAMSDEENESMADRWAALLANAASDTDAEVPPRFPSILRDLSPEEARLLDAMHDKTSIRALDLANELGLGPRWPIAFDNLVGLRLAVHPLSSALLGFTRCCVSE